MNEATAEQAADVLEQVVIVGDLSVLAPAQRVLYYNKVCGSLGLNPLTKPFEYIKSIPALPGVDGCNISGITKSFSIIAFIFIIQFSPIVKCFPCCFTS